VEKNSSRERHDLMTAYSCGRLRIRRFFRVIEKSRIRIRVKANEYWAGIFSSENIGQTFKGSGRSQSHYCFQIRCFSKIDTHAFV